MKESLEIAIALPLAAAIAIPTGLTLAAFLAMSALTIAQGLTTGVWSADLFRYAINAAMESI